MHRRGIGWMMSSVFTNRRVMDGEGGMRKYLAKIMIGAYGLCFDLIDASRRRQK
jgi:hypothetical protein